MPHLLLTTASSGETTPSWLKSSLQTSVLPFFSGSSSNLSRIPAGSTFSNFQKGIGSHHLPCSNPLLEQDPAPDSGAQLPPQGLSAPTPVPDSLLSVLPEREADRTAVLQPHRLPCCFSRMAAMCQPLGFSTYCFLCSKGSVPRCMRGLSPYFLQSSAPMSLSHSAKASWGT